MNIFQSIHLVSFFIISTMISSGGTVLDVGLARQYERYLYHRFMDKLGPVDNETSLQFTLQGMSRLLYRLGLRQRDNLSVRNLGSGLKLACSTNSSELFSWVGANQNSLNENQFREICPSLLLQITERICRHPRTNISKPEKAKDAFADNRMLYVWLFSFAAVIVISLVGLVVVWLIPILPKAYYHIISQLLIALAVGSLAGDALLHLIPHALMSGEGGHSHESGGGDSEHSQMVWKALVALLGIHLFFLTERITILCQNVHSKRKNRLKYLSQDYSEAAVVGGGGTVVPENAGGDVGTDPGLDDGGKHHGHSHNHQHLAVKKQWASKSRKYSGSRRDSESQEVESIGVQLCNKPQTKPHDNSDCPDSMNLALCHESSGANVNNNPGSQPSTAGSALAPSPLSAPLNNGEVQHVCVADTNDPCDTAAATPVSETVTMTTTVTMSTGNANNCSNSELGCAGVRESGWSNGEDDRLIKPSLNWQHGHGGSQAGIYDGGCGCETAAASGVGGHNREIGAGGATVTSSVAHPFQNKPHGHHHGHSHDLSSVKAIAYTVIAGDGLHNFCDGIAIGAAFANDIRGGMSTAIAVLCHELPHELGDFVVLLHAGMSFRTAVFYNLMSSVFCAAGMIIGVLLGRLPSVSSWIFMLTAGMFLYIALVDMMPELSTRRLQGKKTWHRPSILFIWQNIGFVLGGSVMLLIALYEEHMF